MQADWAQRVGWVLACALAFVPGVALKLALETAAALEVACAAEACAAEAALEDTAGPPDELTNLTAIATDASAGQRQLTACDPLGQAQEL